MFGFYIGRLAIKYLNIDGEETKDNQKQLVPIFDIDGDYEVLSGATRALFYEPIQKLCELLGLDWRGIEYSNQPVKYSYLKDWFEEKRNDLDYCIHGTQDNYIDGVLKSVEGKIPEEDLYIMFD